MQDRAKRRSQIVGLQLVHGFVVLAGPSGVEKRCKFGVMNAAPDATQVFQREDQQCQHLEAGIAVAEVLVSSDVGMRAQNDKQHIAHDQNEENQVEQARTPSRDEIFVAI
jgi:hypothetical protein